MERHPTKVPGFEGSLKELAHAIAEMRFDALLEFLTYLEAEFDAQSKGDVARDRFSLAVALATVKTGCMVAKEGAKGAWAIAKLHMNPQEKMPG